MEIQKTVEKLEIAVEKSLDQPKSELVLPEIVEKGMILDFKKIAIFC